MATARPRRRPKAPPADTRHQIGGQVRDVIGSRGLTAYALAATAGVHRSILARFMNGECGLSLENLERVCAALGLRLVEVGRRKAAPAGRDRG